jgi:uncharacterized protein YukJ
MSKHKHSKHTVKKNQGSIPTPNRAGSDIDYNVLNCRPILAHDSPQLQHDHLQVLVDADGKRYWMTINIRSGQDQVFYSVDEDFRHEITSVILNAALPPGFTPLVKKDGGIALDYIRERLVDLRTMDKLKAAGDPEDEGIADMLTTQLSNVVRCLDARLFVFGSRFDDGAKFSSFNLPTGIHDIHMNQGSRKDHAKSNGIFQDGALLAFYPAENRWSAVFLKFASQAEETDITGNPAK